MNKITLPKVIKLLKKHGVESVYFFGSQVDKTSHPSSDYDFGFLFKKGYPKDKDLAYADFEEVFTQEVVKDRNRADIVFLQDAPISLQFRAINNGQMIYVDDLDKATDFEEYVAIRYFDYKPILDKFRIAVMNRYLPDDQQIPEPCIPNEWGKSS